MSPRWFIAIILALLGQVTLGVNPLDSILSATVEKVLQGVEARLTQQEEVFRQILVEQTLALEAKTDALETRLAQQEHVLVEQTEANDVRLIEKIDALETRLVGNTVTMAGALEERLVVENRNVTTNLESRLNLTIGAIMNNMERRLADQTRTMESRLAVLTGTIESRLANHAEAVDVGLSTLKTELGNTTTDRLEALEERIRHEIRTVANITEIQLKEVQTQTNVTIGAVLCDLEASLTALCSSRGSDQLNASCNCSTAQLQILKPSENEGQVTFLRRVDGSVNFTRDWADYKSGFGDNNEFWLGLEKLHQLTTQHQYGLRVDMEDFTGEQKWASYQSFRVGGESGNFVLAVSGYNPASTAGDSMTYYTGMEFSTYDRDNDGYGTNCAGDYKGGWWYVTGCHYGLPTGLYKPAGYRGVNGISWYRAYGDWRSFKSISLKLVGN